MYQILFTNKMKRDVKRINFRECHIEPDWLLIYRVEVTLMPSI